MDPFRLGVAFVAIAGGVMILSAALPALARALLDVVPDVLILALILWVIKALVSHV